MAWSAAGGLQLGTPVGRRRYGHPGGRKRLGIFGRLLGVLGGLAWAVATFLVVPVLAFEEVGPIEALKKSSHLIRTTFGTIAGEPAIRSALPRVDLAGRGGHRRRRGGGALRCPVLGMPIAVLGVIGFFVISMYLAAAGMYMRTILYRYATTGPCRPGVDLSVLPALSRGVDGSGHLAPVVAHPDRSGGRG